MADYVTYNNAATSAAALSDDELVAEHIRYMETPHVWVDDPYWTMIKFEARQRGLDVHAAWMRYMHERMHGAR